MHISQKEAVARMEKDTGYVIVDVRSPEEFAEGHIPGAINIPVETIDEDEPKELPDLDQEILLYCKSGRRAMKADRELRKIGYTNVLEFGGIMTWKGDIVNG